MNPGKLPREAKRPQSYFSKGDIESRKGKKHTQGMKPWEGRRCGVGIMDPDT